MPPATKTETKTSQNQIAYLAIALTLLLVVRLLPILKAPLSTYGYDFGFYYYAASHAAWHWHDFLQVVFGGYNSPVFLLGSLLQMPPAITLTGSYFLAAIFLGLAIYLLMINFGKTAGIFAAVLLACSLFQAESYNMFFWKETLALPFLVLALKFIIEKRWGAFILSFAAVLLLHRTSAIILALTSALYLLYKQLRDKNYIAIILEAVMVILIVMVIYHFFHLQSVINNLLYNNNYYVRTGLFLEGQNLFLLWWPFLALGAAGLFFYLKNKEHSLLVIFTSLCLAWIIFKLPFYRRFLLYLDISVICFAAYFLAQINYSRKNLKAALVVVVIFLIYRVGDFVLSKYPLITPTQVSEIKNFNQPKGFILAVSADDAPWILAHTNGYRLGAPGLLEDPHTYQEWRDFWQGQNQRQFISNYPRPLYFYQRSYHLPGFGISQCLKPLTENFSQLDYACLEK